MLQGDKTDLVVGGACWVGALYRVWIYRWIPLDIDVKAQAAGRLITEYLASEGVVARQSVERQVVDYIRVDGCCDIAHDLCIS